MNCRPRRLRATAARRARTEIFPASCPSDHARSEYGAGVRLARSTAGALVGVLARDTNKGAAVHGETNQWDSPPARSASSALRAARCCRSASSVLRRASASSAALAFSALATSGRSALAVHTGTPTP